MKMGRQSVQDDNYGPNVAVNKKPKTKKAVVVKKKAPAEPSTDEQGSKPKDAINSGISSGRAIRDAFHAAKGMDDKTHDEPIGNTTPTTSLEPTSKGQQLAAKMKQVEELTTLVMKAKAEVQNRKKKMVRDHLEAGNILALQESPVKKSSTGSTVNSVGLGSFQTAEACSTGEPTRIKKVKKISMKKRSEAAVDKEIPLNNPGEALLSVSDPIDPIAATARTTVKEATENDDEMLEISNRTKRKTRKGVSGPRKSRSFSVAALLEARPQTNSQDFFTEGHRSLNSSTFASSNPTIGATPTETKRTKKKKIKVLRKIGSADSKPSSTPSLLSRSGGSDQAESRIVLQPDSNIHNIERSDASLRSPSTPTESKTTQRIKKRAKEKQRSLMTASALGNFDPTANLTKSTIKNPLDDNSISQCGGGDKPVEASISRLNGPVGLDKNPKSTVSISTGSSDQKMASSTNKKTKKDEHAASKKVRNSLENSLPSLEQSSPTKSPAKSYRRSRSLESRMHSPMNDPNSFVGRFGGTATCSPRTPVRRGVRPGLLRSATIADTPTSSPLTPSAVGGRLGPRSEMLLADIQTPTDFVRTAPSSVKSKKHLFESLFDQKSTGNRKGIPDDISMTPKTLKGGFLALNIATPTAGRKPTVAPPKRIFDGVQHDQGRAQGYANSAMTILSDRSKEQEIRDLVREIDGAGGFPATRRLSMRDNELVGQMTMAIRNDPSITSIEVTPEVFGTISSTLLAQFIDALRINLHVRSLNFSGVELGNDFLYSLATSMESNFVIEEIDLSMNLFTNAGLADFCQALASSNDTCKKLNLENQTTPISNASEFFVLEAFRENKTLNEVKLDFQSEDAANELEQIIERNRASPPPAVDRDEKLLSVLRYEAERAQEIWNEQNEEESVLLIEDDDWDHLYDLSVLFDKRKLKKEVQEAAEEAFVPATQKRNGDSMSKEEKKAFLFGEFRKNLGESIGCFNSDGSFLNDEFIAKFFKEDTEEEALTFDFHGQWKLFKRFPIHDPDRATIVNKFIEALVGHSRAKDITGINMANTGCGDDFLMALAERCLDDHSLLPNLYMINFETNFINEDGVVAIAKLIASPNSLKFLQVVRLENQKGLLKSKAEFMLAKAMRMNFSVVVLSLRIRNLMERQQINKYVVRNVEYIRQARQRYFKATGQQRERNQVEKLFDRVADNDATIQEVSMVGNKRFLTLTPEEKVRAAASFGGNAHVTTLNLNSCGIDDEFVRALALSLQKSSSIERLHLEGNDISGEGIMALFEALAKNSTIEELRLHKQSKLLNTSDEHILADILEPNTTITKLGIDLRTTMAQVAIDRKLTLNRNLTLKLRAEAKVSTDFAPNDSFAAL